MEEALYNRSKVQDKTTILSCVERLDFMTIQLNNLEAEVNDLASSISGESPEIAPLDNNKKNGLVDKLDQIIDIHQSLIDSITRKINFINSQIR